ncbi:MAG: GTPase HflX [Betaproteobacteria bacterium]|nr:GTPase HflX [Betaproteobacteria bacterium]
MPALSAAAPDPRAAVLVCLDFGGARSDADAEELTRLAESAGLTRWRLVKGRRERPDAKLFAGQGKVEEIGRAAAALDAGCVVFDHDLSPAQQRNLERALERRVLDRTSLILEIFAQRAQTSEGKLQVELARLERLATRLVRGWTHLERQRGGLGKTGGPGEKQIELDRRMIAQRTRVLRRKLEQLRQRREVQRRGRARREVPSVSLVGYTNAGKSSLFNALAHAKAHAADRLFATLDTTSRRVFLPEAGTVVVSDTVGFIHDLPHALVAAFRATLEETVHADLLLHVVDSASSSRERQIEDVNKVLAEIGAAGAPQILVWNKIDLSGVAPGVERDEYGKIRRVCVSARTGAGLGALRSAIAEAAGARPKAREAAAAETLSL